ncbi:unnamed protein product [Haemonchus placei]|uniref:Uncharacterized protein n=1 Tax=Haemonchus placei TaxID=6290 RepID=A0A0N4X3J3_HAEPC|nr:unnamed protein product [Haemonchus placei]
MRFPGGPATEQITQTSFAPFEMAVAMHTLVQAVDQTSTLQEAPDFGIRGKPGTPKEKIIKNFEVMVKPQGHALEQEHNAMKEASPSLIFLRSRKPRTLLAFAGDTQNPRFSFQCDLVKE